VLAVWESDDESKRDRERMLDELAGETKEKKEGEFLNKLGSTIASDWKLGAIEAYAFNRAPDGVLKTGTVLKRDVNSWIGGRERMTFPLDGPVRNHRITANQLQVPPPVAFAARASAASTWTPIAAPMAGDDDCPYVFEEVGGRLILRMKRPGE
jgi:hypothetical protein